MATNMQLLFLALFFYSSSLFSYDPSAITQPLYYHESDDEVVIATKTYDVIAKLKEKNLPFFSVYTLIANDHTPLIHAKAHYYSNATVLEMYDADNTPFGVITEIHSQSVIFQNKNPIKYELYTPDYSTIAYARRNLFNNKFRIFEPSSDEKSAKTPTYYIKRSKLPVDPIKWRAMIVKKNSSIPPLLLLFISAYQMHAEKRFEIINENSNLLPFNPFLDISVFSEDLTLPPSETSIEEETIIPSLPSQTEDFFFYEEPLEVEVPEIEIEEKPIHSSQDEIDIDSR